MVSWLAGHSHASSVTHPRVCAWCQVLYLYSALDDFVMNNLHEYSGKKLVTVETADITEDKKDASTADKPSST